MLDKRPILASQMLKGRGKLRGKKITLFRLTGNVGFRIRAKVRAHKVFSLTFAFRFSKTTIPNQEPNKEGRSSMKVLLSTLLVLSVFAFILPSTGNVAEIEPLGIVSLSGGAEREQGAPAGGRGTIELVGVWPFTSNLGVQGLWHYVGGRGSRIGVSGGPVFGWADGKAGLFVNYQHRGLGDGDFVWIRPAAAFYLDQLNLNFWYSQPVSSGQRANGNTDWAINQLQGTVHYFPAMNVAPFLSKDNLELTLGIQVNSFGGAGRNNMGGTGVGPVWGVAFMLMPDVTVNLVRATIDQRSRYRVNSGLELSFGKANQTLKELRRKYLEPNLDGPGNVARKASSSLFCDEC